MPKVLAYTKPYTPMILFIALFLFVEAYCALILPGYMADIVNKGVLPGNASFIWRTGGVMLLVTFLSAIASLIRFCLSSNSVISFLQLTYGNPK